MLNLGSREFLGRGSSSSSCSDARYLGQDWVLCYKCIGGGATAKLDCLWAGLNTTGWDQDPSTP